MEFSSLVPEVSADEIPVVAFCSAEVISFALEPIALSSTSWPVASVVASAKDWSVRCEPRRSMLEVRMPSSASELLPSDWLMRARLSVSFVSRVPARLSKAEVNSDTRSSKAVESCAIVDWKRSSKKPERRSISMIASSAVDCRLWRKLAPFSSSAVLRRESTLSNVPVIERSPPVRLSLISLVRATSVSLS